MKYRFNARKLYLQGYAWAIVEAYGDERGTLVSKHRTIDRADKAQRRYRNSGTTALVDLRRVDPMDQAA